MLFLMRKVISLKIPDMGLRPIVGNLSEITFRKRKSIEVRNREIGQAKSPKLYAGDQERNGKPK